MDCKAIQEQLSEYLDDRLPEGMRRRIAAHLDACPACREEAEALQKVIDLVRELPYETAPAGFHETILDSNLAKARRGAGGVAMPGRLNRMLPLMRGVAAAAVIFLFAYLGHEIIDQPATVSEPASGVGEEVRSPAPEDAAGSESRDVETLEKNLKHLARVARRRLKEGRLEQEERPSAGRSEALERGTPSAAGKPAERPEKTGRGIESKEEAEKPLEEEAPGRAGDRAETDGGAPAKAKKGEPERKFDEESPETARDVLRPESKHRKRGGSETRRVPNTLVIRSSDAAGSRARVLEAFESTRRTERRKRLEGKAEEEGKGYLGRGALDKLREKREQEKKKGEAPVDAHGEARAPAPAPEPEREGGGPAEPQGAAGQAGRGPGASPRAEGEADLVLELTLEAYRAFKKRLGKTMSLFEIPSNAYLALTRKRKTPEGAPSERKDAAGPSREADVSGRDAVSGDDERPGNARKVLIRVRIRFEASPPAPAAAPAPSGGEAPRPGAPTQDGKADGEEEER